MSRFWLIAGLAAAAALELLRRRYRRVSQPSLDEVSSDWLAYARSRSDDSV